MSKTERNTHTKIKTNKKDQKHNEITKKNN